MQQLDSLGHPPASEATIWTLENKLPKRCLEKLWKERKNVEARAGPGNVWSGDSVLRKIAGEDFMGNIS